MRLEWLDVGGGGGVGGIIGEGCLGQAIVSRPDKGQVICAVLGVRTQLIAKGADSRR
jgi:hypothetical protein